MVSCILFILGPLWIQSLTQACCGEELSREAVLYWFRERVLEGLGLEEPPALGPHSDDDARPEERLRRAPKTSRTSWVNHQTTRPSQETSQIILFPSSDSSCATSDSDTSSSPFTYYFQPSMTNQETLVTSAHFWFYTGEEGATANSSAPLLILTSSQRLLQAAEAPSGTSSDGWVTYSLEQDLLASVAEGPFLLQVRCQACRCHADVPDKTPFLHLHARPRGPDHSRHQRAVTVPWSPSAIGLFQRPSEERQEHGDCHRAEIEISFEELGWDNWIIQPKVLTFYYCHGNCSASTAAMLGITQCCTPAPGTMKSLRVTTTSDGGYSFKYETLPNIIPEVCTCI